MICISFGRLVSLYFGQNDVWAGDLRVAPLKGMLAPSVQFVAHLLCFPHLNSPCVLSSHFLPPSRCALMLLFDWDMCCLLLMLIVTWIGNRSNQSFMQKRLYFYTFIPPHTKQPRQHKSHWLCVDQRERKGSAAASFESAFRSQRLCIRRY